tara:strand:- start:556 stop:1920 length:1365 start_codon:yes stop_codon:yes gene_type:complete
MDIENSFFDKDNYDILFNVISNEIQTKFQNSYDLRDLRNTLYNIMTTVYNNRKDSSTLDELNKLTLIQTTKQVILNIENESLEEMATDAPQFNEESGLEQIDEKFVRDVNITNVDLFEDLTTKIENERKMDFEKNEENIEKQLQDGSIQHESYQLLDNAAENDLKNFENTKFSKSVVNLDINSGDRRDILINSNPFKFHVLFGALDSNLSIQSPNVIRNVKNIELCNVIISDATKLIEKYPYIYVSIDEIQNYINSTSEQGRKSFTKLVKDKNWKESDDSNMNSFIFMNKCTDPLIFETPLASIGKLSFNFWSPSGTKIQDVQDVFQIENIVDFPDFLRFETTAYFKTTQLFTENRIVFKNLEIQNIDLQNYLLEKEHIISDIPTITASNMSKTFDIPKREIIDTTNGHITYPIYNILNMSIESCYILNLSVQTSIVMKITTLQSNPVDNTKLI